jgi:hypothetical protein
MRRLRLRGQHRPLRWPLTGCFLTSPSIAPSQKKISRPWLKVENSELAMLIAHQPISAAAASARQGCGARQRNVQ